MIRPMRRSRAKTNDFFDEMRGETPPDESSTIRDGGQNKGNEGQRPGDNNREAEQLELPSMPRAFERVIDRVYELDVEAESDRLERELRFDMPASRTTYAVRVDALDAAEDNSRIAMKLFLVAQAAVEAFEIDATVIEADLREQARKELESEKEEGSRRKTITDADIVSRMAALFPDHYRVSSNQRTKAKGLVKYFERLADLWKQRARHLDTMVRGESGR